MSSKFLTAVLVAGSLFSVATAQADHNSIWGAGSANMPNDIHNSAIEDDQDVFMDLVQYGDGADSVNRYDDTSTGTTTRGNGANMDTSIRGGSVNRSMQATRTMGGGGMGGGVSRGGSRR